MAATNKKKKTTPVEEEIVLNTELTQVTEPNTPDTIELEEIKPAPEPKKSNKKSAPKYSVGSIVYVSKEADADLNGFKLFPQYKKYTYTVEAYDEKSGVYTLRRLNLSLRLKEELILAPDEKAHDEINRKQF